MLENFSGWNRNVVLNWRLRRKRISSSNIFIFFCYMALLTRSHNLGKKNKMYFSTVQTLSIPGYYVLQVFSCDFTKLEFLGHEILDENLAIAQLRY